MGNLCSIYHAHFNKLAEFTRNHNQAVFLDKCIFWWQISKYTLNDNKIWFTRSISDMATELSISERSISRYLSEFEKAGILERRCRLSASNKEVFTVKKSLYIRVTEKLLNLLQAKSAHPKQSEKPSTGSIVKQNGEIENANLAGLSYKDMNYNPKVNSTVSTSRNVNNLETQKTTPKKTDATLPVYEIEPVIGERITDRLKNYIKGTLKNLQTQHGAVISDPNKLFAEVVFSVTQDMQWKGIENAHHRVQVVAKLIRQRQWRTPKGFYNHWDVGQTFAKKEEALFKACQLQKYQGLDEDNSTGEPARFEQRMQDEFRYSTKKHSYGNRPGQPEVKGLLHDISQNIMTEEKFLMQLKDSYEKQKTDLYKNLMDEVAIKIAGLYEKRDALLGHRDVA